jgi:hypothetical protein
MELDLQSLFGLLCTALIIGCDPATPPSSPAYGLIYEGAIGQPRKTASLCNPPPKTKKKMQQVVFQWKSPEIHNTACLWLSAEKREEWVYSMVTYTWVSLYLKTTVCKLFYTILLIFSPDYYAFRCSE